MSASAMLKKILQDNRFTPENVSKLEGKLFYEGDRLLPYLVRFTVLLFLSTIIATFGVLQDSTATVIGAMLVAPLMSPILAVTAALVMGRLRRVYESALIVLGGIVMVVGVSFFIGFITVMVISVKTDSQIAARISPNLDDLIVALAAGAVGAFAYTRDDVADSLPGVAIAIALVPPLSVVGITLSQGAWSAAWGASLLFLTNLLSILLAGGLVFAVLGLSGASIKDKDITKATQRKAYKYILIGVLLVAIPLGVTTYRVTRDSLWQNRAQTVIATWLADSGNEQELESVKVFGNAMNITLSGTEDLLAVDELGQALQDMNAHIDDVTVKINQAKEIPVLTDGGENE